MARCIPGHAGRGVPRSTRRHERKGRPWQDARADADIALEKPVDRDREGDRENARYRPVIQLGRELRGLSKANPGSAARCQSPPLAGGKSHFALYSCRHAAIADAKSIYTRAEVAALFGHATDGSCMSGYPRKKGTSSKGGTVESLRASKVRAPRSKDEEKVGVERSSVHAALRSSMRWRISTRRNTSAVSKTPSTPLLSKSVKGVS
jgi:hypothetical protein